MRGEALSGSFLRHVAPLAIELPGRSGHCLA